MEELSMLVQRPSSAQSQEASHLLVSGFRDFFQKDSMEEDTIRNLSESRAGNQGYQNQFVAQLQDIQSKWERKMQNINEVLQHLKQSRNAARVLEQEELDQALATYDQYSQLGLPPVTSKLPSCVNVDLLRQFKLILPQDIIEYESAKPLSFDTDSSCSPQFSKMTISQHQMHSKELVDDNYYPDPGPVLPSDNLLKQKNMSKSKKQPRRKSTSTGDTEDKNLWRDCMRPLQREMEKKQLENLQNRADFLKNPRFLTSASSTLVKVSKEHTKLTADQIFRPNHSPMIFCDYQVGNVYEIVLELKNITSSCRQVQVLPPATQYFSVALGEFPTDKGLIAPGMNCKYVVSFCPDTLGDYEDVLKVKTQAEEPMLIELKARRYPPVLSLLPNIDCGYSLVGSAKQVEFVCQNNGGPGQFMFIEKTDEVPYVDWGNIENDTPSGCLDTTCFQLEPSSFKLDTGDVVIIKVTFSPSAVKIYKSSLYLLCDNCTIKEFTIQGCGEIAHVILESADTVTVEPCIGEMYDASADHLIRLPDQHPDVVTERALCVKNNVSVPLQYEWILSSPHLSCNSQSLLISQPATCEFVSNSAIEISPAQGTLLPNEVKDFTINFHPHQLGSFDRNATLALENIPMLESEGCYSLKDLHALKLEIKGKSVQYIVQASPQVIIMPERCYVGLMYRSIMQLENRSLSPVNISWDIDDTEDCNFYMNPQEAEIAAGTSYAFELVTTGLKPGKCASYLRYQVPFSTMNHGIFFEATFVGPQVTFEESCLDFGLVRFGTSQTRDVTITNTSPVIASWRLQEKNARSVYTSPFHFDVEKGVLEPHCSQKVSVTFKPYFPATYKTHLECLVHGSQACHLPVHAEVLRPHVCLKSSHLYIKESYLDVPVVRKVTLVNTTLLSTEFFWKHPVGDFVDAATLSFTPATGTLKPQEEMDIEVVFTGLQDIEISDLLVTCQVSQMLQPLVLLVSANVKGLSVDISIPSMEDIYNNTDTIRSLDALEFGNNIMIGENPKALIILENKSAISTHFNVFAENFPPGRLPTPPEDSKDSRNIQSAKGRPLLAKASKFTQKSASSHMLIKRDVNNNVLSNKKGVAFVCEPSCGELDGFAKQMIEITAYSDMWGEYIDNIICQIGDLKAQVVPLNIDIIGSPLNFQMSKEQPPTVRFGSHVSGGKSIRRNMKINNTSYEDIRLDWKSFILDMADEQLIDLDVYIGEPFPEHGLQDNADDAELSGPLIKVLMSEHQGRESNDPFSITPTQVVIPGKSHNSIEAIFNPQSNIKQHTDFLGYALGFMTVAKKDRKKSELVTRADGLSMLPFALNMTGSAKPSQMLLEACDEGGCTFNIAASELLITDGDGNDSMKSDFKYKDFVEMTKRYILSNNSGAPLSFSLQIGEPFRISVKDNKKNSKKQFTLKPAKNLELSVGIQLRKEQILSFGDSTEATLKFEQNLKVKFSNGFEQSHQFLAIVSYPKLALSSNVVDFGTCYVGEPVKLHVYLENVSLAAFNWQMDKDPKSPEASRAVFSLQKSCGYLEECSSNLSKSREDITIVFNPKHNMEYECIFIVSGALLECPLNLLVRGVGSYDESTKNVHL